MGRQTGTIANRRFKIVTGLKSQTVNIYEEQNDNRYEFRYRIRDKSKFFADGFELEQSSFSSINELETHLFECRGAEREDVTPRGNRMFPNNLQPDLDWGMQVTEQLDKSVNDLLHEFIQQPYKHRVEHSLHCDLFRSLAEYFDDRGDMLLLSGGEKSQLVHKEWPEPGVRRTKSQRGGIDVAVLSPQAEQVEVDRFLGGYITPFAAFELGLDYGLDHFCNDVNKLHFGQIPAGYVIHCARHHANEQEFVEERIRLLVEASKDGTDFWPKIACAIMKPNGSIILKNAGDATIKVLNSTTE